MILVLRAEFSSAHLYRNNSWTAEQNREAFGDCYSEYGHGHNYWVEVGLQDPGTDQTRKSYRTALQSIALTLHNRHLNFEIEEFKEKNPTTENLVLYFEQKIRQSLCDAVIKFIKVYESDTLGSETRYER
jgi:6-pyruvoyltetrahydropterin/6-carboxytetrahydropterin synthase